MEELVFLLLKSHHKYIFKSLISAMLTLNAPKPRPNKVEVFILLCKDYLQTFTSSNYMVLEIRPLIIKIFFCVFFFLSIA
jgi:hypothetical protein